MTSLAAGGGVLAERGGTTRSIARPGGNGAHPVVNGRMRSCGTGSATVIPAKLVLAKAGERESIARAPRRHEPRIMRYKVGFTIVVPWGSCHLRDREARRTLQARLWQVARNRPCGCSRGGDRDLGECGAEDTQRQALPHAQRDRAGLPEVAQSAITLMLQAPDEKPNRRI